MKKAMIASALVAHAMAAHGAQANQPVPRGIVSVSADAGTEVKALIEGVNKAFADFKAEHSKQLEDVKKGQADALQALQVDRINTEVAKLQAAVDDANLKIAAAQMNGGAGAGLKDKEYTEAFNAHFKKGEVMAALNKGAAQEGDLGQISLKGLSGDDLQKALEAVFSKLGDQMASFAVGGLEQFQKVGEGYLETLTRVATDYANLDSILESMGTTFGATGMASIAAREHLIELAGGIDQLASQANSFTSNFLSKAEQLAPVQKYVTDQLAAMGLQSLDSRDKFKDYVLGLANSGALATEAGAQQYAALLALADAFAKTHAATVDLTKSEQEIADERTDLQNKLDDLTMTQAQLAEKARAAIDSHNLALYDQVQAAQAAKDAIQAAKDAVSTLLGGVSTAFSNLQTVIGNEKDKLNSAYQIAADGVQASIDSMTASVSKLQGLSDSLHSTLDSMTIPGQEKSDRAAAQAQIEAALAIAKAGGPLPVADSLKTALSTVSKDASGQFGSYIDYMRDLYRTKNNVGALSGLTDSQLSAEQLTLKTLQAQKTALDEAHKQDIAALDATLAQAKTQTDLLNGIYTSLMTLPQALAALGSAVTSAQANSTIGSTSGLVSMYQSLLGRAPDAAGLEFWQTQVANGASLDAIRNAIMSSSEYTSTHLPAFAGGGDHAGGLRLVGEDGPEIEATGPSRIFTASQTRSMLTGSDNADVVAELRAVRSELVQVKAEAKRSADSVELLKRVIRNDRLYASTKEEVVPA